MLCGNEIESKICGECMCIRIGWAGLIRYHMVRLYLLPRNYLIVCGWCWPMSPNGAMSCGPEDSCVMLTIVLMVPDRIILHNHYRFAFSCQMRLRIIGSGVQYAMNVFTGCEANIAPKRSIVVCIQRVYVFIVFGVVCLFRRWSNQIHLQTNIQI